MKQNSNSLILLTAIVLLTFSACELLDDPLPTDARDNFVGTWAVNETSSLYGINNYTVVIRYDPNSSSQVLMSNFYHFGDEIDTYAIPTAGSLTVPQQEVCNHTVKGTGILTKNTITWSYSVNDGADLDQVTAVFTKQ